VHNPGKCYINKQMTFNNENISYTMHTYNVNGRLDDFTHVNLVVFVFAITVNNSTETKISRLSEYFTLSLQVTMQIDMPDNAYHTILLT